MALRVKSSHIIAVCISLGIAAWMANGTVYIGGEAKAKAIRTLMYPVAIIGLSLITLVVLMLVALPPLLDGTSPEEFWPR